MTKRVAIVGGGLAGTACAFILGKLGASCALFDTAETLAWGASGNPEALVNPRLSATRTAESDFYAGAFALAARTLARMGGGIFRQHGSLHLATTPALESRYRRTPAGWGWPEESMRFVDPAKATEIAGVTVRHSALWLPDAGTVDTVSLCARYAGACDVRLGQGAITLERKGGAWRVCGEPFDAVILACGLAVTEFAPAAWLPLHPVRGQLAFIEATENTRKIRCALCYGGTIAPQAGGMHVVGSTFQKGRTDTSVRREDEQDILEKLQRALPDLSNRIEAGRIGWAAVRAVAHDRFPIAGRLPDDSAWEAGREEDIEGLYVSTAHGAHGVVTTLAAAQYVAGDIMGLSPCLPRSVTAILSPHRFLRRQRRKEGRVGRSVT